MIGLTAFCVTTGVLANLITLAPIITPPKTASPTPNALSFVVFVGSNAVCVPSATNPGANTNGDTTVAAITVPAFTPSPTLSGVNICTVLCPLAGIVTVRCPVVGCPVVGSIHFSQATKTKLPALIP